MRPLDQDGPTAGSDSGMQLGKLVRVQFYTELVRCVKF